MGPFLVILCQLSLTILVEGGVILLWQKSREILKCSLFANLLTNPPLNLILMFLSGAGLGSGVLLSLTIAMEIVVVIIEAIAYKFMLNESFKKAFVMSLILNLTSYLLGNLLGIAGYWKLLELMLSI